MSSRCPEEAIVRNPYGPSPTSFCDLCKKTSKIDEGFHDFLGPHVNWCAFLIHYTTQALQGAGTQRASLSSPRASFGADSEGPSLPDATVVFLEPGAAVVVV